ncbi:hypothetical protein BC832DRAFT_228241 [Gaertneriomyces semiglobifer]|nr:hypothetical protein BC832DRAFT_228241 [Gaertneriomyces semiglobifer]
MPRVLHWATRTYAAIGAGRFRATASQRPSFLLTLMERQDSLQGRDASGKFNALGCSSSARTSMLAFRNQYFENWPSEFFYGKPVPTKEQLAKLHSAVMRRKQGGFTSGEISNNDYASVEVYMNMLSEKKDSLNKERTFVDIFSALVTFTAQSLGRHVPERKIGQILYRAPAFKDVSEGAFADLVLKDALNNITFILESKRSPCARHHPTNEWDQALQYCVYYAQEFVNQICTKHPGLGLDALYGLLTQRLFFCTQVLHTVQFYEISLLDLLSIPYRQPATVFCIGHPMDLTTALGHHHWRRSFEYIWNLVDLRSAAFRSMVS